VAQRGDEIVALACELIAYDTTSREDPAAPARQEAELQGALAERLRAAGAEVDLWEPAPEDVAGHPLTPEGGIGFEGRPQLAARLRGTGGGGSLLLNGHIDVVPGQPEQFRPRVEEGRLIGRGACDMKGGIAAMVIAAETLAQTGDLRGDVIVCTNTDEESSGVGALACTRRGVAADFAIVPEPSGLEVWPACRGSAYCEITVPGRAGHTENGAGDWREGAAVNAIEMARHVLAGVERLRGEWAALRHPLLPDPQIVVSRLVADSGWSVTLPDRAEITLAVLILPVQADADGWTQGVRREVESYLRRWCDAEPWLAEHPPAFAWHTEVNPSETRQDAASVQALLHANAALGLPLTLGGLGSWYDGATFALEAGTPAVMYGPRFIDQAHTVTEFAPVEDLIACAQGIAIAGWRLCR
jgi:acetylornithine deacetylase